ncbi:alpha/beta hydrolase [Paracnuella aquatica]|uniref:alpha/beta hydrolase n=1 Tax=Paracnuella aquatica TaxID=2268757 RepID=UPI000DEF64BA|nr:alpha/beta hydrolase [Paracnuella aquatica]RPD44067.1 alpha/beta hydrolase [Paracnuella aquatica]
MKQISILIAVWLIFCSQVLAQKTQTEKKFIMTQTAQTEYYTFKLSDKVTRQSVTYPNRYGITVAADLYLPKSIDTTKNYAALIVGTPYGGVKEQGAGIYAQAMAERGFVAIAFDESYNGESGGTTRRVASSDIFTEDFSAGVDYLGTLPYVDRQRIGVIGLCGSGAFSLAAAQVDTRIKAVATSSMVDMSLAKRMSLTGDQRKKHLDQLAEQRWKDVDNGTAQLTPEFPAHPVDRVPEGLDPMASEFFEYYGMKRGHHPNSKGAFTVTSDMSLINFHLLDDVYTISPRPILFVVGEKAFSKMFSDDAYNRAAQPKELYVVPGARHIDLYDRTDLIPFDKLSSFFNEHLKAGKV